MKPSKSASRNPDRPRRKRGIVLRIYVYPSPTLLQRVEDAMQKTGLSSSRSALIASLLDKWAASLGC